MSVIALNPLIWAVDFKPDLSFNVDLEPSWSPDIYSAVLWDHNINFNISLKVNARIELAEYTYF